MYDFTGVRDMDLVLRMAADTGLYVLARPGPYINGELNAGGFPGWLTRTAAVARSYRAQIFLNGWNAGQYISNVGPQSTFVLPAGLLRAQGQNTLAIAVLADGTTPGGLGSVALANLGTVSGGVPVLPVFSPGHAT